METQQPLIAPIAGGQKVGMIKITLGGKPYAEYRLVATPTSDVILPQKNARDLDDVPKEAREAMEFILADDMSQVIAAALEPVDAPAPALGAGMAVTANPSAEGARTSA